MCEYSQLFQQWGWVRGGILEQATAEVGRRSAEKLDKHR